MTISNARNERSEIIPTGVKVAYGSAEGATATLNTAFAIFFLIFLTDVAGINPAVASIIPFVAVAWDAVTDPFMGIISDRTRSRYGRRRPYLIGGAIPLALTFGLLFTVPPLQGYSLLGYYMFIAILFHTAYSVVFVPYLSLLPEITRDYNERTSAVSYKTVWACIGSLAGSTGVVLILGQFSDEKVGWSWTAAILGFFCIFLILHTWHGTRGWERHTVDTDPLRFKEIFSALFGNRSLRYALVIFIFSIAANYALAAITMYFLRYWMAFTEQQISLYFLIFFVTCALWVPLITFLTNRIGKPASFIIFMCIWALTCTIGHMLVQPGQDVFMYALACLDSLGMAATFQLCWSMIPDIVEIDEFKTGRRREGLFLGTTSFVFKAGIALSVLIVGQLLNLIGYTPETADSPSVLLGIRIIFGPFLAGMILVSIVTAFFFPITRKRHKALLKAIEAKKAGETWDEEAIKKLL